MKNWISVKERLPKDLTKVWAWDGESVWIAEFKIYCALDGSTIFESFGLYTTFNSYAKETGCYNQPSSDLDFVPKWYKKLENDEYRWNTPKNSNGKEVTHWMVLENPKPPTRKEKEKMDFINDPINQRHLKNHEYLKKKLNKIENEVLQSKTKILTTVNKIIRLLIKAKIWEYDK